MRLGELLFNMDMNEEVIKQAHIPELKAPSANSTHSDPHIGPNQTLQSAVESCEREFISEAYKKNRFNKTKTAKDLNISIRNLYYKLEKYQLDKTSMQ